MIADRKDFTESLKAKHAERQTAMVPVAQLVQGAAVLMDKLPRTPEWQRYCEYLQGYIGKMAKRKELAVQKLGDPSVTNDEDVRKLRADIFMADVSMDVLKLAVELPAYILKGGEEAEEFMRRFEKKNETTEQAT